MILICGILLLCIPLSYALGFNHGIDKMGDLKEFNDKKFRHMNRVLNE